MLTFEFRTLAAAAALALLTGCGSGGDDAAKADENVVVATPLPLTPDPGTVVDPVPSPPLLNSPGVWSSGSLTIRAETPNLRVTDERFRTMSLGLTVTFENASDQPVAVILARNGQPAVQLDNGLNMEPARSGGTGILGQCNRDLDECRNADRERFVEVESGKTLSVTMTLVGRFPEGGRPELQTVNSATLTMRVYALEGDGLTRTLDVSLKDFAIQNRVN